MKHWVIPLFDVDSSFFVEASMYVDSFFSVKALMYEDHSFQVKASMHVEYSFLVKASIDVDYPVKTSMDNHFGSYSNYEDGKDKDAKN